jgi:hypothetical protein
MAPRASAIEMGVVKVKKVVQFYPAISLYEKQVFY